MSGLVMWYDVDELIWHWAGAGLFVSTSHLAGGGCGYAERLTQSESGRLTCRECEAEEGGCLLDPWLPFACNTVSPVGTVDGQNPHHLRDPGLG